MPNFGIYPDDSSSFIGGYGAQATEAVGAPPHAASLTVLSNLPSLTSTMGWNSFRGSRTILGGGFDQRPIGRFSNWIFTGAGRREEAKTLNPLRRGPALWQRVRNVPNPFSPRSYGRMANQSMMFDDAADFKHSISPLNSAPELNRVANFGLRNILKASAMGKEGAAEHVGKLHEMGILTEDVERQIKTGGKDDRADMISRGFFGRLSASSKVSRMSGDKLAKVLERKTGLNSFLNMDKPLADAMGESFAGDSQDYAHLIGMSMNGRMSQYAMGYVRAARIGQESEAVRSIGGAAGKEAYIKGSEKATEVLGNAGLKIEGGTLKMFGESAIKRGVTKELAEEGVKVGLGKGLGIALEEGGAKAAATLGLGAASELVPGLNILTTAMMAYDFGKMGVGLIKGGIQTAEDAGKSMKGSIEKGVMGMGYRDNTVAATSRQRGVMAIQNSQLNARSVLGNEASMIHSHFG